MMATRVFLPIPKPRLISVSAPIGHPSRLAQLRQSSSKAHTQPAPKEPQDNDAESQRNTQSTSAPQQSGKKTQTQLDQELREKLEGMSGGAAGVTYENGQARGLRREVKRNMFRLI